MNHKILTDREKRYEEILRLGAIYQWPVVCGKINCPGSDKNISDAQIVFGFLRNKMQEVFTGSRLYAKQLEGDDGASLLLVVSLAPMEAKRLAVAIEDEHPLGRLFDVDVYLAGGEPVSRQDLGGKARTCLLCQDEARNCVRSSKHSTAEIFTAWKNLFQYYGVSAHG